MKILECSTKGCDQLSSFYAEIKLFGKHCIIEHAYHMVKRFDGQAPISIKDCKGDSAKFKGVPVTSLVIEGNEIDAEYLTPWYYLLWLIYLDSRPDLVKYASGFDDFTDMFKGKSKNSQADVIKMYVKEGREAVLNVASPVLLKLKEFGLI